VSFVDSYGKTNNVPVITYVKDVTTTSFSVRLGCWLDQKNEPEIEEKIYYMALEEGEYTLASIPRVIIKVGRVNVNYGKESPIGFGDYFSGSKKDPVVIANSQTFLNDKNINNPVKSDIGYYSNQYRPFNTQLSFITKSGCKVELATEEDTNKYQNREMVGYIAIQQKVSEMDDINNMKFESGSYSYDEPSWKTVDFSHDYKTNPVLFGQIQSANTGSPLALRRADTGKGETQMKIENTDSNNKEKLSKKDIGWLAFDDEGLIKALISVGEAGTLTFKSGKSASVEYDNGHYRDPVVIVGPVSYNRPSGERWAPVQVKITSKDQSGFTAEIEKWQGDARDYWGRKAHYIVMEKGNHYLSNSSVKVEAGSFNTKGNTISSMGYYSKTFSTRVQDTKWSYPFVKNWFDDENPPLVFTQVQNYEHEDEFAVNSKVWESNKNYVTGSLTAYGNPRMSDHNIGYIAIEAGDGDLKDIPYTFANFEGVVKPINEQPPTRISLDESFSRPLLIAQSQTYKRGDNNFGKNEHLRFHQTKSHNEIEIAQEHWWPGVYSMKNMGKDVAYMAFNEESKLYAYKNVKNAQYQELNDGEKCTISGTVEMNGEPVAGVKITIMENAKWFETMENGKFEFLGLDSGIYTLKVQKTDLKSKLIYVKVGKDGEATSANIEIIMEGDGVNGGNPGNNLEGWGDSKTKYISKLKIDYIDSLPSDYGGDYEYEYDPNIYEWENNLDLPDIPSGFKVLHFVVNFIRNSYEIEPGLDAKTPNNEVIDTRISTRIGEQVSNIDVFLSFPMAMNVHHSWSRSNILGPDLRWKPIYPGETTKNLGVENIYILYFTRDGGIDPDFTVTLRSSYEIFDDDKFARLDNTPTYNVDCAPGEDLDKDGISNQDEYSLCENPKLYGLSNEYTKLDSNTGEQSVIQNDEYGLANPEEKDIFLEIDTLPGVIMTTASIVEVASKFAYKGIKMHIDDGCLGGGGSISATSEGDAYNSDFTSNRSEIFKYCVISPDKSYPDLADNAFSVKGTLPAKSIFREMTQNLLHYCIWEDSDDDGIVDYFDLDFDQDDDGLPDKWEEFMGTDPRSKKKFDTDHGTIGFRVIRFYNDRMITRMYHLSTDEVNLYDLYENDREEITADYSGSSNILPSLIGSILYPSIGCPAIVCEGGTLDVYVKNADKNDDFTAQLINSNNDYLFYYPILVSASADGKNSRAVHLVFQLLDKNTYEEISPGLYDLVIGYNNYYYHSYHSVQIIGDYKSANWNVDPNLRGEALTVVHVTDTHIGYGKGTHAGLVDRFLATINRINEFIDPDFVIITGDITENAWEEETQEFKGCLLNLRSPAFVVPGNHDHGLGDGGDDFFRYINPEFYNDDKEDKDFEIDMPGAGTGNQNHYPGMDYDFNYGDFHFVMFDSGPLSADLYNCECDGLTWKDVDEDGVVDLTDTGQLPWIMNRIEAQPEGTRSFIFTHASFISQRNDEEVDNGHSFDQWDDKFVQWANGVYDDLSDDKIEAAFCGHTHEPWISYFVDNNYDGEIGWDPSNGIEYKKYDIKGAYGIADYSKTVYSEFHIVYDRETIWYIDSDSLKN